MRMETVAAELPRLYDLLRQSRLLEAERALAALLRDAPQVPAVHRARAAVAQSAGRIGEAVDAMRTAAALAPDEAPLRLELGQVLAAAGRIDEAIDAFRQTAALKPDLIDAWYLLGMTLYGARRDADALPALQRALALAPTHPQLMRAVAETEYALEHHAEALALYERLAPTPEAADPALCLRLSQCRRRLGAPADALAIAQAAVARFPDDAPLWLELGWVQEDLGDATQAQQAYARAHALRPDWGDPIGAAIALARGAAPDDIVRKAGVMAEAVAVPEPQRAYLHHVLGKRSDSLGDYPDAARHWTEANRLRRAQDGDFEREVFAAQIDAAIATFTPERLASLRANALCDEHPLFVVGMPRSGTTLVEQILAAHPQGHGCGELTGIVGIADDIPAQTGLRWPQDAAQVDGAWLRERAQAYLARAARGASADARRLVDKQPYNFLHVGLIAMLFADARIVWCRRDPRDIALSIFSESFAPSATYATDRDDIAFVIAQQERLMRHWQAVSPLPILAFEYERIVADTEAQIRRLVDFAGLPWDDRCLDFHASGRSVQTLSRWQVRQPMHARSVGRWRNYPAWFCEGG
jgi:tetratricopeptide (TPR) repeat protein